MKNQPLAILALPKDCEIESTEEVRIARSENIFRKTIRYRNGIVAVLFQDLNNNVFHIELRSVNAPFWMSRNHLFMVECSW